jgi:hypothetical protein
VVGRILPGVNFVIGDTLIGVLPIDALLGVFKGVFIIVNSGSKLTITTKKTCNQSDGAMHDLFSSITRIN